MRESKSTGCMYRLAVALLGVALTVLPGCASTGKAQARIDAFNQSAGPMIAVRLATVAAVQGDPTRARQRSEERRVGKECRL